MLCYNCIVKVQSGFTQIVLPIVCLKDTKKCPNGDFVVRSGPKCEFLPCHVIKNTIRMPIDKNYLYFIKDFTSSNMNNCMNKSDNPLNLVLKVPVGAVANDNTIKINGSEYSIVDQRGFAGGCPMFDEKLEG